MKRLPPIERCLRRALWLRGSARWAHDGGRFLGQAAASTLEGLTLSLASSSSEAIIASRELPPKLNSLIRGVMNGVQGGPPAPPPPGGSHETACRHGATPLQRRAAAAVPRLLALLVAAGKPKPAEMMQRNLSTLLSPPATAGCASPSAARAAAGSAHALRECCEFFGAKLFEALPYLLADLLAAPLSAAPLSAAGLRAALRLASTLLPHLHEAPRTRVRRRPLAIAATRYTWRLGEVG